MAQVDAGALKGPDGRLMESWRSAVEFTDLPPSSVERALMRGFNVRVKFPEAFLAAYETFEASAAVGTALAIHATWPVAVVKCYRAAMSVCSALVESMKPLSYVTAVILSKHNAGVESATLRDEVSTFLDDPGMMTFGWHLAMTGSVVDEARGDRGGDSEWFDATVRDLESGQFLTKKGNLLLPRQKHIEWKWGF